LWTDDEHNPGLYTYQFPSRAWIDVRWPEASTFAAQTDAVVVQENTVVFVTVFRSQRRLVSVNVASKSLQYIDTNIFGSRHC
jgi:hypothetical protein